MMKNKFHKLQMVLGSICSLSLIVLVVIVVYTAVLRYVFKNSPDWGYEVSIFIFGIYAMLSGAYVLKHKGHVRVDVLVGNLSGRKMQIVEIVSNMIIILVAIALVIYGTEAAYQSTLIREKSLHQSTFNPEIWWFRWFIPMAGLLIMTQSIFDLVESIRFMRRKNE